jgi:2-dehydropantoate 2-reductase
MNEKKLNPHADAESPLTSYLFSSYLIIGAGRVSRHFQFYLESLSIPFLCWNRREDPEHLKTLLSNVSHVLLLISDSEIENFYSRHPELHDKICVHFSGALVSKAIFGAHPLMTFSDHLYDLEVYQQLPFVIEKGRASMADILPGFPNPSVAIEPQLKDLYHALCSMGGNFTVLLWEKIFNDFEKKLDLPKQILLPYLLQTTENLALSPMGKSVLTGPLVRGDRATVDRHLQALSSDSFEKVYRAFVAAYNETKTGGTK